MINKNPAGRELHFRQNLIVIAAPFAGGKTHTIGQIDSFLFDHNLFSGRPITDSTYIEDALESDHRYNNGMNHMHANQTRPEPHEHYPGEPNLHFSVTGSYVPHYMYKHFFHDLSQAHFDNYLWAVEWSGGANTNSPDNPASHADYSFVSQVEGMRSGIYERGWISKVLMVIHPEVPDGSARFELNQRRKDRRDPTEAEIAAGMASWWIPEPGMKITGRNDFPDAIPLLEDMGLSGRIHTIKNDGGKGYDQELRRILDKVIVPILREQEWPNGPEGRPASTTNRDRR